jgi:glycosyltransferase involved in cell wall biosynthesis
LASLLKAPNGNLKGCVVFTTQERDHVIAPDQKLQSCIAALKKRYVVGLHHNWHDHQFRYNPLFDFSMAGEGDLIEAEGRDFPRIPVDACNFAPPCYSAPRGEPFWDILYVARAVNFKGIPEFFAAIRGLYDAGRAPRVLFICTLPEKMEIPGIPNLRAYFESLFSAEERKRVTLLTLEWDYPFPLDAETLAHFYRSSRIFFHAAPQERRCRTAAYAWAGRMPVVATESVASILPSSCRRAPFLFTFAQAGQAAGALAAALDSAGHDDPQWAAVSSEFSARQSAERLSAAMDEMAARYDWGALAAGLINSTQLDIRLGRHHGISKGGNCVDLTVLHLCDLLLSLPDIELRRIAALADPEKGFEPPAAARMRTSAAEEPPRSLGQRIAHFARSMLRA